MFDLKRQDLPDSILDCGGGPASFSYEASQEDSKVSSVDPIYEYSAYELRKKIEEVTPAIRQLMEENPERFTLDRYGTPEEVVDARIDAMETFLADYPQGKKEGRYIPGDTTDLPFENGQFDLALSSHFLFLYDEQRSLEFHFNAIREILRVACELRIFPLTNLEGSISDHLRPVLNRLYESSVKVEVRMVPYEFQRGSNQGLVLRSQSEPDL